MAEDSADQRGPRAWADAYRKFLASVRSHPLGAALTFPLLGVAFAAALIWWQFPAILAAWERMNDREFERQVLLEDDQRDRELMASLADTHIRERLLKLRQQSSASRAVVRVFTFDMAAPEQITGILDVFESMDMRTEQSGIRNRPLPLTAIQETMNYMLASDIPRCIAKNTEDYEGEELRRFLLAGDLKASVACPLRDIKGKPIGLIATSIRTRLEDNDLVLPMTRDASLEIGPFLAVSKTYIKVTTGEEPTAD